VYEFVIIAIVVAIVCLYLMIRREKGKKRNDAVSDIEASDEVIDNAQKAGLTTILPVGMLISKSGSHRGLVYTIGPSGVKIGRDRTRNQIIIENAIVSREHAWIGLEDGNVVIKDLNSQNGTYLNSLEAARVETAALKDGDVIYIGKNGMESYKYKAG
jgi:pSer/pThr/pTyr-binding forkhead associated (FHA) protein